MQNDSELTADAAIELIKEKRPGVHCSKRQMNFLYEFEKQLRQAR